MTSPSFVFFGTSKFSKIILEKLKEHSFTPTLIVTGEDRPQGRGLVLTPPPVKIWAEKNNVPILQPKKLKDPEFIGKLKIENCELFVLASYGRIIPSEILKISKNGVLNVHPSLLPKLRGPSPIQSAILEENEAGVSIILLDEEIDHGPILAQQKVASWGWPASPEHGGGEPPYYSELETLLGNAGGTLLAQIIPKWVAHEIVPLSQDHTKATFTKKIEKSNAPIDLNDRAETNLRKIRAYSDSPVAFSEIETKKGKIRVKIKKASMRGDALVIETVVPEGSKEMSWSDFERGFLN